MIKKSKKKILLIYVHGFCGNKNSFLDFSKKIIIDNCDVNNYFFESKKIDIYNTGIYLNAWYIIYDIINLHYNEDIKGINLASRNIYNKINKIIEIKKYNNVFIIGFSQGAAISLYTFLNYKLKINGIVIISGYLPIYNIIEKLDTLHNHNIPILVCHGKNDYVININHYYQIINFLKMNNYCYITKKVFNVDHEYNDCEIKFINEWLIKNINEQNINNNWSNLK